MSSRASSKLYNLATRFWYRVLRRPIYLKAGYQRKVKNPELTVIFLHGISATSDTWRTTIRQFSLSPELKSVRFLALDLLGFGKSLQANWLDYDYDDYQKALTNSLKKYKVRGPFVIVGHSMGSLIAAKFAVHGRRRDLKHLILVSPPVLLPEELAKLPDKVYMKSYSSLYRLAREEPIIAPIANFIQRFSNFDSKYLTTPAFARSMENIILNHDNYKTFTKIKTPALIIHGHFDPLVMRSNLKHAAEANPQHLRFISVMGHHDISAQKRSKMFIELKRILRETQKDEK